MLMNNENLENLNLDETCFSDELFKINKRIEVPKFSIKNSLVPELDKDYVFDEKTTMSILMGLIYNKKVLEKLYI